MKRITILILTLMLISTWSAQVIESTPLIQVEGSSIVYTRPDEILLNYAIHTEGEDLLDARERNAEISEATVRFLKESGIADEHIQTRQLHVGIRYRNHRRVPEDRFFQASQRIHICITDTEQYEDIIMGLLQYDIHDLSSPIFRTTRYRELMDQAREQAIVAAKEKAQDLAEVLGQSIGPAYHISEDSMQSHWPGQNAYANTTSGTDALSQVMEGGIALGQLEIEARVTVSFHLKE